MQQIKLMRMQYRNFKGIKSFEIEFSDQTNIYGANGTGKTSLYDGFTWLLFGKDSSGKTDFNIKTLDENNNVIHRLEHEVEATISVNGEEIILKRIYTEKWTKKRGEEREELTGNTQSFFYNNVPLNEKSYNEKINAIIDENLFKLLTSPTHFNSLPWQKRREILTTFAGQINNEMIVKSNPEFAVVLELTKNKTVNELVKEIMANKKKIKDELTTIPARIDEADRMKPEQVNLDEIKQQINIKEANINTIDLMISDKNKQHEEQFVQYNAQLKKKQDLIVQRHNFLNDHKKQLAESTSKLNSILFDSNEKLQRAVRQIKSTQSRLGELQNENEKYNQSLNQLRSQWMIENSKELVFNVDENCPVCKQQLPIESINQSKETQHKNFNENKSALLATIAGNANIYKSKIEANEEETKSLNKELINLQEQHQGFTKLIEQVNNELLKFNQNSTSNPAIEALDAQIKEINPVAIEVDSTELVEKKKIMQKEINDLMQAFTIADVIDNANKRINELMALEAELSQKLAELEKQEYLIQQYTKKCMAAVEEKINSKFSMVKFKLFNTLINGGEELCCDTLLKGVPYPDVNTAGKINAGLDIINALSIYYQISAPIWIDNNESINTLFNIQTQKILLNVSTEQLLTIK